MNKIVVAVLGILVSSLGLAQNLPKETAASLQRQVRGQILISKELPAAELTFGKDFRYLGGQVVNLYGNADAEQHLFVKTGSSGAVERFYWVQFEHFLPSNTYTYDYKPDRTLDIGDFQFIYDVKSFSDYAALQTPDPASDGAAITKLLAQHQLAFPKKTARVRMFHLPTADRRAELMIIYGETLPEGSKIPASDDGVHLDDAFPDSAKTILDHARKGLTIRKR
ncbi:MAG: hypothetical protein ACLP6G_20730 [Terriglobales bacterium]